MAKKKHEEPVEEEEVAPFWMISFSDMMTLLLSFFIILFSMSTIEVKKMTEFMEAMGNQFGGKGHGTTRARAYMEKMIPAPKDAKATEETPERSVAPATHSEEETPVNGGAVLFDAGSDLLGDTAKAQLKLIALQLEGSGNTIAVRGHASLKEAGPEGYKNVDDLAYTRAWNVREFLVEHGLKREQFILIQAGSFAPLKHSALPPGSEHVDPNAYVEVVLLEKKTE